MCTTLTISRGLKCHLCKSKEVIEEPRKTGISNLFYYRCFILKPLNHVQEGFYTQSKFFFFRIKYLILNSASAILSMLFWLLPE